MEVGQFIYTRLDKSESPVGRNGFQTVCYTRSLIPETLLAEIESHLQCNAESDQPQLLFHPVGQEHVVLVQLKAISEVDNCGRGGNFVAHGIILSHQQFLTLGGNPISLAQRVSFVNSGAAVKRHLAEADGDLPPYHILPDSRQQSVALEECGNWHGVHLRNLIQLAVRCCMDDRQTVALYGPRDRILTALQVMFELLPRSLRPLLSFATHCQRLQRRGPVIQGFPVSPQRMGCAEVNATDHVVDGVEELETSFGRWVRGTGMAVTAEDFLQFNEECWWLGRLIDTENVSVIRPRPSDRLIEEFWRLNEDAGLRRVLQVVQSRVGHLLAQRAIAASHSTDLFAQIAYGLNDAELARLLHVAYCQAAEPPGREELSQLTKYFKRFPRPRLLVWLAIWTEDWSLLITHLRTLDDPGLSTLVSELADSAYFDVGQCLLTGREKAIVTGLLRERGRQTVAVEAPPDDAVVMHRVPSYSNARLAKLQKVSLLAPNVLDPAVKRAIVSESTRRGLGPSRTRPRSRRLWRFR